MELWHDAYANHAPCGEMDFDPGFKSIPMLEQLAKIIDSESLRDVVEPSKFKPCTTVVTEEGDEITVSAVHATIIRTAVMAMPPQKRLETLKELQTTAGLTRILKG